MQELIAGVDEVGRGCLAGPVVAAAVILPNDFYLRDLTDSKKLTVKKRELLAKQIKAQAIAWAFGFSWPREIERINILQASLKAMYRAVLNLKLRPTLVLVDGNQKIPFNLPQQTIIKGDSLIPQISAASILAKTIRDKVMFHLDKRYPGYGLAKHKGYATKEHLRALASLGPSVIHRLTFKGVREKGKNWLPGI
ncbi:RNase HII [Desulfonauticus submarinus]|uniref:Ribonuclease HII n=1 Tax=Desulfonauticus submarinus TaxID=206665 RepID=A0A1H0DWP5_9BACT|nr:ribonuclease HII [Desulfonauticus submarinus]SDN74614.1 RNase HII [Desulfonauticus submarinus]